MPTGRIFRFGPARDRAAKHLFLFLHGSGATARSMIPIAFGFQARFPSAALVVPNGFGPAAATGEAQDWFPTRGLNDENRPARVAAVLPEVDFFVRREQTNFGVPACRTVLIGYSQGGTVALEAVKANRGLVGAVVAYSARFARLPPNGTHIDARIHLVHGEFDSIVWRVHAERAARALAALHVPVTLDIIQNLGHALTHAAICRGSLRLLQGIYEGRRATVH